MSPNYKLTYFDGRALGEPIRFTFGYAGVSFEDVRIDSNWPEIKADYPWGTLPVLEVDGKVLAQSGTILSYLGKQFNLAGEDDWENAKCDEMIDAMADLRSAFSKFLYAEKDEKKAEVKASLLKDTFPNFLTKWSKILMENNGFLVGQKLSIADFCVASFLQIHDEIFEHEIIGKYPAIVVHQELVLNAPGIKEWVEKRPKSNW